jgi:multidrug resistance efflux pump
MKKKKTRIILIVVIVLIALGGGFAIWDTNYQDTHFYKTENAQVMSDMIDVYPLVTGKLTDWNVKVGDMVTAGQVLGHQDTSTLMTSSASGSSATLGSAADSVASKSVITAPIDGMVIQASVVNGEMIAPGTAAAVVAKTSDMYITANVEETNIFKIKTGQEVDITIDAYPGQTFHGYVVQIGKATNSLFNMFSNITTSGTFSKTTQLLPVKISIDNASDLTLYPGFNATVKVHIQ